jgi:membrane associated rhomboid family serine protease
VPVPLRWQWKIDRVKDAITGFFRSNPENARPRMCPSCGTLVGTTATKCHQCGASIRFGMAAASRSLGRMMPTNSPATYAIVSLCCLMYGITLLFSIRSGNSVMPEGTGIGALMNIAGVDGRTTKIFGSVMPLGWMIYYHQPWRLITAIFLHANLLHIAFNMWVLMDVGPRVEEIYGSARYLFLYIATGILGYVLSSIIGYTSVGASGSIMGLVGLLIAVTTLSSGAAATLERSALIRWVIIIFAIGFFPGSNIDNYAHFGGLASGFLLGKLFVDRPPQGTNEVRVANALGWGTALMVIGCFALMLQFFFNFNK